MATINQAAALLLEHDNMTILCHRSPDGDTLGAGYALLRGLRSLGKQARLLCADPPPPDLVALLGDITDASDFAEQFVVAVDIADSKLLGRLAEQYGDRVDLAIDHHQSHRGYSRELWLEPHAAATCEMMTALLDTMQVPLTKEIATCLYVGLATDTGCFRYASTTPNTMRAAATLMEHGVDSGEINRHLFESKKRERLAVECEAQCSMEYYFDDHCAVMTVPTSLVQRHGLNDNELDGLSALPRQIEGVWVGITIREQPDHCRVSVRTTPQADASAICAAFGGGGHLRAGGCSIHGSLEQAKTMLIAEAAKHLGYKECQ